MILSVEELFKLDLSSKTVVFPTDTVYGVGCLLNDEEGIHKLFQLKERDYSKPLAILAPSFESVIPLVKNPEDIRELAEKYWPGALTIVAPKSDKVSDLATANQPTVGIRIPNDETALRILDHYGPMVVTSLNKSTQPALLKFGDVLHFRDQVDYIIFGGDLENQSSTVYDVVNQITLRQGDIVVDLKKD